jgi:tRNA(Ile)-lysidine synthase
MPTRPHDEARVAIPKRADRELILRIQRVVAHTLQQLRADGTGIVGLSGGPDSACLTHALQVAGYKLIAVHVDHHLRDSSSDRRAAQRLCEGLGIEMRIADVDTIAEMRTARVGMETAARRLRHDAFHRLMDHEDALWIALGHTRNDQVETILMHLFRGAGLTGLSGMRPVDPPIVRPLLSVTKAEALAYCQILNLPFADDPTNADQSNPRNRVRHTITPAILEVYPGLETAVVRMGLTAEQTDELVWAITSEASYYVNEQDELDGALFRALPQAIRSALVALDSDRHLDYRGRSELLAKFSSPDRPGPLQQLELLPLDPVRLALGKQEICGWSISTSVLPNDAHASVRVAVRGSSEAYLKPASGAAVAVRGWRAGDGFRPSGSTRQRKLQDLFTDMKLDRTLRHAIPIVTIDDSPGFVPGIGVRDDLMPSSQDAAIMRIRCIPPEMAGFTRFR